jgi:hypothetical protein
MSSEHRFTVYDVMDRKGVFRKNTANAASGAEYRKQIYPRMFYHPEADEWILTPGELIATLEGPRRVGQLKEIIWKIAKDPGEEAELRALGWHDHPAKAIAAGIALGKRQGEAPPMSSAEHIASLEEQIANLQAEKAEADKMKEISDGIASRDATGAPISRSGEALRQTVEISAKPVIKVGGVPVVDAGEAA